ncbi:MAG: DEAD/DEAH box helicase [Thermofilaceae archaeon]
MKIDELPLSDQIKLALMKRGITELFPPQELAVKAGLLDGVNLVVTAPTASGKTLIAVLAAFKNLTEGNGKVLYLTPLRSLASEKYEELNDLFGELEYKVALSAGDFDSSDPWLDKYDLIVTTNEKADSLLRHGAPWLKRVALVVVDEVHLIGDSSRGPTLEILVSRLRRVIPQAQLVCLSATIANLGELAQWLEAVPVECDWRPVLLKEGVYYDGAIEFSDGVVKEVGLIYGDPLLDLVCDSLDEGGQALLFTFRRRAAFSIATRFSAIVEKKLKETEKRILKTIVAQLLSKEHNTVTEKLVQLMAKGVAFHHAGLSYSARKTIEEAFKSNLVKVVVATPTLAAGVNLPARRVVIADRRKFNSELGIYEDLSVMEYKQMAGRAGRPKYDKIGEAILIARTLDEVDYLIEEYVKSSPERIISKLATERALRSQILAEVASGLATNFKDINETLGKSLYASQYGQYQIWRIATKVLEELSIEGLVKISGEKLKASPIGRRISELYIDPRTASIVMKHLTNRKRFTDLTYLHLIAETPDMPRLYLRKRDREWLDEAVERRSDELIESPPDDPDEYEFFLASLKVALLLHDWIEEESDDYIYEKYDIGPGDLYSITQTAEWLIYASSELAKLLLLPERANELTVLRERVKHGIKAELLELVSIRGIGRVRARALYAHGFKSVIDIARADVRELSLVPSIGPMLAKRLKESILSGQLELGQISEPSITDYLG